jgi:hypothetical protein
MSSALRPEFRACARCCNFSHRLTPPDKRAGISLKARPGFNRDGVRALPVIRLVAAALLIAGFVRFLIVVFLEVPLLAVVLVFGAVSPAFALPLLVCLVLRIIRFGALLLLEKRSGYRRRG